MMLGFTILRTHIRSGTYSCLHPEQSKYRAQDLMADRRFNRRNLEACSQLRSYAGNDGTGACFKRNDD